MKLIIALLLLASCSELAPKCAAKESASKNKESAPKEVPTPSPKFFYGDRVRVKELSAQQVFFSKVCKFEGKIVGFDRFDSTYRVDLPKSCRGYDFTYNGAIFEETANLELIAEKQKGK